MGRFKTHEERQRKIMATKEYKKALKKAKRQDFSKETKPEIKPKIEETAP